MNEETIKKAEKIWEVERINFQTYVLRKVLKQIMGDKPDYKSDDEWAEERHVQSEKLAEFGEKLSVEIEKSNYKSAIMKGEYEPIAQEIIDRLHMEKLLV